MRTFNTSSERVSAIPTRTVNGRSLVHWRLTKRDRRRLALEILAGRVAVTAFTVRQAAALVGLDVDYIRTARNGGNSDQPKPRQPSLADLLVNSSAEERASAAARLGPAVVWDTMVAPLIDEERTGQQAAE
jgi:hypothetical protein